MDEVTGYGNNDLGNPVSRWVQASFISSTDVSVLTLMAFDLDKKTVEATNLAGLGILTIVYKEARKGMKCQSEREYMSYLKW